MPFGAAEYGSGLRAPSRQPPPNATAKAQIVHSRVWANAVAVGATGSIAKCHLRQQKDSISALGTTSREIGKPFCNAAVGNVDVTTGIASLAART